MTDKCLIPSSAKNMFLLQFEQITSGQTINSSLYSGPIYTLILFAMDSCTFDNDFEYSPFFSKQTAQTDCFKSRVFISNNFSCHYKFNLKKEAKNGGLPRF